MGRGQQTGVGGSRGKRLQMGLCPDYQQTAYETVTVFLEIQFPPWSPWAMFQDAGLHSCCTCAFSVLPAFRAPS